MSSAMEILKGFLEAEQRKINHWDSSVRLSYDKEFVNALGEGILALEQVRRLKECIEYFDAGNYLEENEGFETPEEVLIRDIKKVLGGTK